MEKLFEEQNNLAKELITTASSSSYIQVINPTTGKVQNLKISDLASVVAGEVNPTNTLLPSGGVYESVDLGLPSGTLWAKYNVGASKETEYGDLFAWGATSPYRMSGTTPLDNTDNYAKSYAKTIQHDLYPNEDAATVNWGKGWVMPTKAQLDELVANTTYDWTTISGINGGKFTASNGNYIFFPAAGYVNGGSLYARSSRGYYWSRTFSSSEYAWLLIINSSDYNIGADGRIRGLSVRPVRAQ